MSTFKSSTLQQITRWPGAVFHARRKFLPVCLAGLGLLAFLSAAVWIRDQARRGLAEERARAAGQDFIPFEKSTRAPLARTEIKFWQNTESTRSLIRFQDSYFAATDGGMVQFSPDGKLLRHFTVLDGLTESDLLSFAIFDSKLFIGTASQGLLAFDGERFESYRWPDREAQAVNALLADGSRLLCGTFGGGLIEFDGRRFTELKAGVERARLLAVNCLFKDGSRLYVGTFNDGLWLLEAGRWLHFRVVDGLVSNRVVGVAVSGENVFVASDFGLASATSAGLSTADPAEPKRFRTLATLPSLSGLISYGGLLLTIKDNGELLSLDREASARGLLPVRNLSWPKPVDLSGSRLMSVDDTLWLLGSRGIWHTHEEANSNTTAKLSLTRFGHAGESSPALASNVISALTLDAAGRFWAGNFRRGIDVLSGEGKKIAHLESESIREINFLLPEAGMEPAVLAATSHGVVRFAAQFRSTNTTKADGLPGNSIMHLSLAEGGADSSATKAPRNGELVTATGRGLGVGQQGKWRALTTVQGLPSNQIYTTRFFKRSLFVGTLGGLAQVESGRVVRVFTDSNSKLTHNWVTGLCAAGARLFVGTYGGGVFELAPSNELHGFAQEIGTPVVNPNAMWSDGEILFVGTLDGARVFDLHTQKWTHLRDELPARTVLSITGDAKYVYFGTTNGIARVEKSYLTGI